MSRYIEINGKIVRYNKITKRRKTCRRGGGFEGTACDFIPMEEKSFDELKKVIKTKTRNPIADLEWNLQLLSGHKYRKGGFNIVVDVGCIEPVSKKRKAGVDIVCRILKTPFYNDERQGIMFVGKSTDSSVIDPLTREIIIQLQQQANSVAIYDIQAISINHPLLQFLEPQKKIEMFKLPDNYEIEYPQPQPQLYVLCIIMERGDPYEITSENFDTTMTLFESVAKNHICIDVKPANLLYCREGVKMIDFDPYYVKETTDSFFRNIKHPVLFGSCMMKYLFCMYLIIRKRDIISAIMTRFMEKVTDVLDELIASNIELTDGTSLPFMFIMSSLYNIKNNSIFGFTNGFDLSGLIDKYHFTSLMNHSKLSKQLFIQIRKYLIDCEKKAEYEYMCLKSSPKFEIKYDMATQSLRYYIKNQCPPSFQHSFIFLMTSHICQHEIYDIEFSIKKKKSNTNTKTQYIITFSYTNNRIRESETFYT